MVRALPKRAMSDARVSNELLTVTKLKFILSVRAIA